MIKHKEKYDFFVLIISIFFILMYKLNAQSIKTDSGKQITILDSIDRDYCPEPYYFKGQNALGDSIDFAGLDEGVQVELKYHRKYYDYLGQSLDHRQKILNWQYYSQIGIFILVIVIVIIGLYFSWIQFNKSVLSDYGSPPISNNESPSMTNLEFSFRSIKISSSFVGLIILVISLAFFYLYLVHIYPIEEISSPTIKP